MERRSCAAGEDIKETVRTGSGESASRNQTAVWKKLSTREEHRMQVESGQAGFFRKPPLVQLSLPDNLRLRLLRLWLPPDILSRFHYLLP